MKLGDALARSVRCHPDKPALVTDDGRSFTYAELDDRSTRLANAVTDRIGAERFAVLAINHFSAIESMWAGNKRGLATVQLSYRATVTELQQMADTAEAEALIFDDHNADDALELLDRGAFDVAIHAGDRDVDHEAVESYEAVLDEADPSLDDSLPADDECAVLHTSGTTSVPKAVAFDSHQLWLGAYQGVMEHGIDRTDTAVVTTPWYHMVTSDAWLYPHWLAGATTVLHSRFDPEGVLELVEEHGATGLLAVPTQLEALTAAQAEGGYDTGSLRYVRTAGAVLTEELVKRTTEHLCEDLYNTYGMTEGGPNLTFAHPADQRERPGTVGKESFAWELRVVESVPVDQHPDPEATVDAGERGEVIARGPGVPDGYIDNPAAEKKSFFGEWLRTRDVARIDEEGFLYVVDRVDNMFISGGENVYPGEVEAVLEAHEAVDEAIVVGLTDEYWGNKVAAVVVTDGSVDEAALDSYCKDYDRLADYKRPQEYALRTEPLPKTDTGTVERDAVVNEHFG